MSRTLVLMRHAKAEGFADDDHARRLTARGHRQAESAGSWLAERDCVPTGALVSSAARTLETWTDVAAGSGSGADAVVDDGLYSAGPDAALNVVRAADATDVLIVIGHNPTTAYLAHALTDATRADADAFRALSRDFPTAAISVFEVDGGWAGLTDGCARLTAFWAPA